jgi:hypothetical protein
MTQEQKELLIKDICARLDTNLVCSIYRIDDYGVGYRDEILSGYCKGDIWDEFYFGDDCGIGIDNVSKIKPYLFPLSSMTEEQKKDIFCNGTFFISNRNELGRFPKHSDDYDYVTIDDYLMIYKKLIENHFDINGLIPRGLAEDATDKNIY